MLFPVLKPQWKIIEIAISQVGLLAVCTPAISTGSVAYSRWNVQSGETSEWSELIDLLILTENMWSLGLFTIVFGAWKLRGNLKARAAGGGGCWWSLGRFGLKGLLKLMILRRLVEMGKWRESTRVAWKNWKLREREHLKRGSSKMIG